MQLGPFNARLNWLGVVPYFPNLVVVRDELPQVVLPFFVYFVGISLKSWLCYYKSNGNWAWLPLQGFKFI